MFRALLGRRPVASSPHVAGDLEAKVPALDEIALILDRFCLAYQGSFCSVCAERCPVPGAIVTELGKPRINPDLCTGCRICHDVCPAPKNAVFLIPKKPKPGMIGKTVSETEPVTEIADD